MESRIRPATLSDCSAVEAVVYEAYSHYTESLGTIAGPLLDNYRKLIDEGRVHVLEQGGEVRGIVVLIPEPDAMLLDNVAVSPRAQGGGFGRKLIEFAEQAAIAAGYARIKLYTQEAMTENVALYHRIGYRDTHKAQEKGLRRVYMVKDLAAAAH